MGEALLVDNQSDKSVVWIRCAQQPVRPDGNHNVCLGDRIANEDITISKKRL